MVQVQPKPNQDQVQLTSYKIDSNSMQSDVFEHITQLITKLTSTVGLSSKEQQVIVN